MEHGKPTIWTGSYRSGFFNHNKSLFHLPRSLAETCPSITEDNYHIHLSIHLFNQQIFQSTYYMTHIVLDPGDTVVSSPHEIYILEKEKDSKVTIKWTI